MVFSNIFSSELIFFPSFKVALCNIYIYIYIWEIRIQILYCRQPKKAVDDIIQIILINCVVLQNIQNISVQPNDPSRQTILYSCTAAIPALVKIA